MSTENSQEYVELIPGIKMSKEEPFTIVFDVNERAGSEFAGEFGHNSSPPPTLDGKPNPMHLRYLMERLHAMLHSSYEKDGRLDTVETLLRKAEKESMNMANAAKEEFYRVLSDLDTNQLEFLTSKCIERNGHTGLLQFAYHDGGWKMHGVNFHELYESPARNESKSFSSLKETLIEYILNCANIVDRPGRTERMLKAVSR